MDEQIMDILTTAYYSAINRNFQNIILRNRGRDTKQFTLYDSIYMMFYNRQN